MKIDFKFLFLDLIETEGWGFGNKMRKHFSEFKAGNFESVVTRRGWVRCGAILENIQKEERENEGEKGIVRKEEREGGVKHIYEYIAEKREWEKVRKGTIRENYLGIHIKKGER